MAAFSTLAIIENEQHTFISLQYQQLYRNREASNIKPQLRYSALKTPVKKSDASLYNAGSISGKTAYKDAEIGTGHNIPIDYWDKKNKCLKIDCPDYEGITARLETFKNTLSAYFTILTSKNEDLKFKITSFVPPISQY